MSCARKTIYLLLFLIFMNGVIMLFNWEVAPVSPAFAEKEEMYTSSDEFLPLGAGGEEIESLMDLSFLEDDTLIHNAMLAGIRLLKDENKLIFRLKSERVEELEERSLKFEVLTLNFPPRIVIRLYGIQSEERIFRFFKNLNILGVILNPFVNTHVSEFVVFLEDWAEVTAAYSQEDKRLTVEYSFTEPPYTRGFGVRIVDSKIDPLPHIAEIQKELTIYGLGNHLLMASDEETVVLESPFFMKKEEAITYIESLEGFGYMGKLAIRDYKSFPQPHRFDVVSEVVITGEGEINLESIVYSELIPEKIFMLTYSELYLITKQIFSPRVQNDEELIAEYYYSLSEIYRNYDASTEREKMMAVLVSVKLLEVIYFTFPDTGRADDALWEMANMLREYGIQDRISELECYNKIIEEYPESIFLDESNVRIRDMKEK
jgi:hypothetical protein